MRKDRILKLADTIEKLDHRMNKENDTPGFTMTRVYYSCGSPACIGGWTYDLFYDGESSDGVKEMLGISGTSARRLMGPLYPHACWHHGPDDPGHITVDHAVKVLRNLAKTGEVDWRVGTKDA